MYHTEIGVRTELSAEGPTQTTFSTNIFRPGMVCMKNYITWSFYKLHSTFGAAWQHSPEATASKYGAKRQKFAQEMTSRRLGHLATSVRIVDFYHTDFHGGIVYSFIVPLRHYKNNISQKFGGSLALNKNTGVG